MVGLARPGNSGTAQCIALLPRYLALCEPGSIDLLLAGTRLPLKLAAKRLASGEWLLVMTNISEPRRALQVYRRRWGSNVCSAMPRPAASTWKTLA